jgi:AI-2 transport protein TqsA
MPIGSSALSESSQSSIRDMLLVLASIVIILAGARAAANLLIPFILALFLAVICSSPIHSLRQRGAPRWLAAALVGISFLLAIGLLFILLGSTADSFAKALPLYEKQFTTLVDTWAHWLGQQGVLINRTALGEVFDPADALSFFGGFISSLGEVLSNFVLIFFTVIFLLTDATSFGAKISASKSLNYGRYLAAFQQLVIAMNGYITSKAIVSLLTAAMIWLGLFLLGVDFAVLWAFLAFALNFVPNIGSIIAAVPPVLLSLLAQKSAPRE